MTIHITLKKIVITAILIAAVSALASNFSIQLDDSLHQYMNTRSTLSAVASI
ncbi:MAG: hypothetical protein OCD01_18970 [Fibrobacterales bacterium]